MTNIGCKKQPRLPIVEIAFYFVTLTYCNRFKYFDRKSIRLWAIYSRQTWILIK
jgi:hypothetical protein